MTVALLIVAALIIVLLIYAATKPNAYRVARTTRINAPADKIFPNIIDFHRWAEWSPYERLDPAMKKTYSGPPSGRGAIYEWSGNGKVGEGRMEIIDVAEPSNMTVDLRFVRPFKARNSARFTLAPNGSATDVTWSTEGPSPYFTKLVGVFMNMDHMIGKDFEVGLANLKSIAER